MTQRRLMGLLQWNPFGHEAVAPFLLAGIGYGWQRASLTEWQCESKHPSGLVFGAGAGVEVGLSRALGLNLE